MSSAKPIEVAIVGGGCAGVSAAFELTRPEHRGKYHVTLYQLGWRLGGKGASGRGVGGRIEEHGFHVWMGFYENAFRLLRDCYDELGRDRATTRIADWQDAFKPTAKVGLADRTRDGAWQTWMATFPPEKGLPGDPFTQQNPFSLTGYLVRAAVLLRVLLSSCQKRQSGGTDSSSADRRDASGASPAGEAIGDAVKRILKLGVVATMAGLMEAVSMLELVLGSLPQYSENTVLHLIDSIGANARRQLAVFTEADDEARRLWEIIDMVLATMQGIIRFGLLTDPRGLDAIDDYDWRDWLRLNGASDAALNSAFVRGIYALTFAYEDGDFDRPRLAAGAALRGTFRMLFTYRGSLFWRMHGGMGDVVFAPFYEVLKRRGVRFEFFHRLENVKLADAARLAPSEKPYVEALEFHVQAEVKRDAEYQPLVDVRGLPCWPAQPDYAQLVDGNRLAREGRDFESYWDQRKVRTKTLRVVDDFDFVVLGVGIGAIPHVCREIVARDPRWSAMVQHVKTVATQAFQIWLHEGLDDLGWAHALSAFSAFAQPFDTWADMRHLLAEEAWPVPPRGLAYACSALPDPPQPPDRADVKYPARRHAEVRRNAVAFLNSDLSQLWPKAARSPGDFRWELLADPAAPRRSKRGARADESRFDSQFWKANVNPSDRYTLALPGSARYRISPLDNTYDNLTIAGDWTHCGDNTGCVEAAVMSGRLAAHAIAHTPPLEDIIGYDHP
jgi:uncharacterized protein with NAD-binding domain and iron-sulfur cluster